MARATFGGGAADWVMSTGPAGQMYVRPATLTFWDAQTGGTQYTDLLVGAVPTSTISVPRDGQVPVFSGPDNIGSMWADAGSGDRVRLLSDKSSEALASDTFIAEQVANPASETAGALSAAIGTAVDDGITAADVPGQVQAVAAPDARFRSGLYLPSEHALLRWRAARARTLAGERQGHVAVVGDSIPYGAAAGAVTAPKYLNNWVGRLRRSIAARYGEAGTGIVFAEANKLTNPTWDPRWTLAGNVTNFPFGLFKAAAFRVDAVAGSYIEFAADADAFVIYNYGGSAALNTAAVDGVDVGTFRNHGGAAAPNPTLARRSGDWVSQVVSEAPAGAYGPHTLRLTPNLALDTNDMFIGAVEARRTENGTFRITEAARSGMSFLDLYYRAGYEDAVNGLYGLPMLDMIRADLLVIALGVNDWMGGRTVENTKATLKATIQRQRATTAAVWPTNGAAPAGDVLMVWNPQPDLSTLGLSATAPWDDFRAMFYDVADEENAALLDLGGRWSDYATGNAAGLFADGIHPNDAGSLDMSTAIERAIFDYA